MSVSEKDKATLKAMRDSIQQLQTTPEVLKVQEKVDEVRMDGVSAEDLKLLCNPVFTNGVDFNAIDTSAPFTAQDMNIIAPGAIDIEDLRRKLAASDLTIGTAVDVVASQSGNIIVTDQSIVNGSIDTLVEAKTASQGINLQFINVGKEINKEATSDSEISSKFVGEN